MVDEQSGHVVMQKNSELGQNEFRINGVTKIEDYYAR